MRTRDEDGGKEGSVHIGAKSGQSFVKVIHLGGDADGDHDGEDVGGRSAELVISAKGHLQGQAKALDGHDGDGADEGADGDVDHGVRAAVARRNSVYHDEAEDEDDETVHHEAWVGVFESGSTEDRCSDIRVRQLCHESGTGDELQKRTNSPMLPDSRTCEHNPRADCT